MKRIGKDNIGSDWGCVYSPKQIDLKQIHIHTWKDTEQLGTLAAFREANEQKMMGISSKVHTFWVSFVPHMYK